jgi:hypothetical protein
MSFQSAIPWRVALRQSLPPLHRLVTILNNPLCRTMIFQRTATTPLTSCLSPRVHSRLSPLSRFLWPYRFSRDGIQRSLYWPCFCRSATFVMFDGVHWAVMGQCSAKLTFGPHDRPPKVQTFPDRLSGPLEAASSVMRSHPRGAGAAAFLGRISPMRRIWAPTPRSFSSICS